MDEQITERLNELFDEIADLKKDAAIFHLSGRQSNFTVKVAELGSMHESLLKYYEAYKTGNLSEEQFRTEVLTSSDLIQNKIHMLRQELTHSNNRK